MTEAEVRRYLHDTRAVRGWLFPIDASLIAAFDAIQGEQGITGDLFEIGVHHGKSAILLGRMVREGERLGVCDVFGEQHLNVDHSGEGSLELFRSHMARFAAAAPVDIFAKRSDQLTIEDTGTRCRLMHIDGGHRPEDVINDLHVAERALLPHGIVVVDDVFNPSWPGVGEGVHTFFAQWPETFVPLIIGGNKAYFARREGAERYRQALTHLAVEHPAYVFEQKEWLGHSVLVASRTRWVDLQPLDAALPHLRGRWLKAWIVKFLAMLALSLHVSAQCFEAPVRYSAQADAALLVRDLDGDGAPDIMTSGNQTDELDAFSLLVNRGDGTFAPERRIASTFGQKLEDVGDLNGDGVPDLVVSNYWANGIAIYIGDGRFGFAAGPPRGTATHGGPSLITDYDRDGIPDVISFSFGSGNPVRVHFFRGLGDGTLAPKVTIDTTLPNANWPSTRVAGGALEILVSPHFGRLGLLRYADGVLTTSTIAAGPGVDLSSTFADLNGDGNADIVETNDTIDGATEPIFITLGRADGTFGERKRLAQPRRTSFPFALRMADLDGDGHPDLVVADFRETILHVYRGNGAGDFAEGVAIDAGGPVNAFVIADVDHDGRPDIVTANSDHTISVIRNRAPCPGTRRRAMGHTER